MLADRSGQYMVSKKWLSELIRQAKPPGFVLKVALGAKGFVFDIVLPIDGHLFTFENKASIPFPAVDHCFPSAFTDRFQLLNAVGQQQQSFAAVKPV